MIRTITRLILLLSPLFFLGCLNPGDEGIPFVGLDAKNKLVDESIDQGVYRQSLHKGLVMAQDSALVALQKHEDRNPVNKLKELTVGFGLESTFAFPHLVTLATSGRVRVSFERLDEAEGMQ